MKEFILKNGAAKAGKTDHIAEAKRRGNLTLFQMTLYRFEGSQEHSNARAVS